MFSGAHQSDLRIEPTCDQNNLAPSFTYPHASAHTRVPPCVGVPPWVTKVEERFESIRISVLSVVTFLLAPLCDFLGLPERARCGCFSTCFSCSCAPVANWEASVLIRGNPPPLVSYAEVAGHGNLQSEHQCNLHNVHAKRS